MDETDPETALAENPAGGGNMAEVAAWVGAATLFDLGVGAVVGETGGGILRRIPPRAVPLRR